MEWDSWLWIRDMNACADRSGVKLRRAVVSSWQESKGWGTVWWEVSPVWSHRPTTELRTTALRYKYIAVELFTVTTVVNISGYLYAIFTVRKRSCGKVMFLHLSVILSGGGCLPQCMLGYTHPVSRHPPWSRHPPSVKQTPPRSRHYPPEQTATAVDGTHPTGMHSCSL